MKDCLNCVRKHLSQAMVVHEEEVPLGYPEHIDRVVGHLAEASRETVAKYPALAAAIRDQRLKVMDDPAYYPPYQEFLEYVGILTAAVEAGLPVPALPDALAKAGEGGPP